MITKITQSKIGKLLINTYNEGYMDGEIDALDKLLRKAHMYVQDGHKLNYLVIREMIIDIKKEGNTNDTANR